MKVAKFQIRRWVKLERGWRCCRECHAANHKPKPNTVVIDGHEETYTEQHEGYFIKIARKYTRVGSTLAEAQAARTRLLAEQSYRQTTGEALPDSEGTSLLAVAADKFYAARLAQGRDAGTLRAYRTAIDPFVAGCKKRYVEQIEKQDLFDYLAALRKRQAELEASPDYRPRRNANAERTYANKMGHLAIFLKFWKVSAEVKLRKSEYPEYEEKPPKKLSDEELEVLYARADPEQRFLLTFGLNTGFRDGEISHAEYSDLAGNIIAVKRKPEWHWKPKRSHCREVRIPEWVADEIRQREKEKGRELIFPNEKNEPDQHLLRKLQRLMVNGEPDVQMHRLRKTWASRMAGQFPLHELRKMLGHKSLATTQKYLADLDLDTEHARQGVEEASYRPKPTLKVVA